MDCKHSEVEVVTGLKYILQQAILDTAEILSLLTSKVRRDIYTIYLFKYYSSVIAQSLKPRLCTAQSSPRLHHVSLTCDCDYMAKKMVGYDSKGVLYISPAPGHGPARQNIYIKNGGI